MGVHWQEDKPCKHLASGNADKARLLDHIKNCDHILDAVCKAVVDELVNEALKSEMNQEKGKNGGDVVTPDNASLMSDAAGTTAIVAEDSMSGPKLKAQSTLDFTFTEVGRKKVQDEVNLMILKLVCVDGLVPHILDSENWRNFVTTLASR